MKVETIKQFNLITYLALTIFLAWSNFYRRNNVSGILKDWINSTTWYLWEEGKKAWKHESMLSCHCTAIIKVHENQVTLYEACFHAFVLQLSRYMKIRWHYMYEVYFHTYTFIKCFQISPPDSNVLENGINLEHSALWQWNSSWNC